MTLRFLAVCGLAACASPAPSPRVPFPDPMANNRCQPAKPGDPVAVRTRRSRFVGPAKPKTLWVHEIERDEPYGFAVDGDATVYAAVRRGMVAIERDGQRRWIHDANTAGLSLPALGPDGALYLRIDDDHYDYDHRYDSEHGGLVRIDACGKTAWKVASPPRNASTPAIGRDGTVYFAGLAKGSEVVYAVKPDRTIAWSYPIAKPDAVTTPLVAGDDGAIYFATFAGTVAALEPDGRLRWSTAAGRESVQSVAVGDDGSVYAITSSRVFAFDGHGHQRWALKLPGLGSSAPAIASDGTLYVGGANLRAIQPDGTLAWTRELSASVTSPIIARDGTLYVATNAPYDVGQIYALDRTGAPLWSYFVEAAFSLALGADGLLYVSASRRLYAIGECTEGACEDDGSTIVALNHVGPDPHREPYPKHPRSPPKPAPPVAEPHDGYTVYPGCNSSTTAIVTTEGTDFAWYESTIDSAKYRFERERFRGLASGAARVAAHGSGFGMSCVDPRGAFVLMVLPGSDVASAATQIGQWLVREHLRGEVDLLVTQMPHDL